MMIIMKMMKKKMKKKEEEEEEEVEDEMKDEDDDDADDKLLHLEKKERKISIFYQKLKDRCYESIVLLLGCFWLNDDLR